MSACEITNIMSIIVFSGGASGADDLWVQCADKQGCPLIQIMTFEGHKRTVNVNTVKLIIIPQEELLDVKELIMSTGKLLHRKFDERPFVYNLIARNYYIIKNAQVVYAVGYLNQRYGLGVDGGTAWGCEYFKKLRGVDTTLYFFDMCTNKWVMLQVLPNGEYEWVDCDRVPSPKEFERVGLIGSRELTEQGKMAIAQVW